MSQFAATSTTRCTQDKDTEVSVRTPLYNLMQKNTMIWSAGQGAKAIQGIKRLNRGKFASSQWFWYSEQSLIQIFKIS